MIAAAGAVADGLVGHPIATRRWHREVTLPGLRAAEAAAGRAAGACALAPYVSPRSSGLETTPCAMRSARSASTSRPSSITAFSTCTACADVGQACRAALRKFDVKAMADAVPDALVEEIAIACTPDEARQRLEQWQLLTDRPLLYAPTVGVPPERLRANLDAMLDVFGAPARGEKRE